MEVFLKIKNYANKVSVGAKANMLTPFLLHTHSHTHSIETGRSYKGLQRILLAKEVPVTVIQLIFKFV